MDNNKFETISLTNENVDPGNKKYILRYAIPPITLLLHLLLICSSVYILLNKIDNLESKIIATIKNNTSIATDSELIMDGTNEIMDELLQENIPKRDNENDLVSLVIIAHTDTHECEDFDSCKYQVKMLQLFYIQFRNFEDIGYNFLIGGDGVVYEGIDWEYVGDHTSGHNDNSIGIGFIGNYQNKMPTEKQLSAAKLLLEYGLENNYLDKNYVIKGQRDCLTIISPGDNLYNRIKKWAHFFKRDGI